MLCTNTFLYFVSHKKSPQRIVLLNPKYFTRRPLYRPSEFIFLSFCGFLHRKHMWLSHVQLHMWSLPKWRCLYWGKWWIYQLWMSAGLYMGYMWCRRMWSNWANIYCCCILHLERNKWIPYLDITNKISVANLHISY